MSPARIGKGNRLSKCLQGTISEIQARVAMSPEHYRRGLLPAWFGVSTVYLVLHSHYAWK